MIDMLVNRRCKCAENHSDNRICFIMHCNDCDRTDAGRKVRRHLAAISGAAETYWGKNKGRSMEGKLEKFTKLAAVLIFVLALVLNLKVF